jgi:hypothetical protein
MHQVEEVAFTVLGQQHRHVHGPYQIHVVARIYAC